MNLNQISKRLDRERDREVVKVMAARFEADADRKSLAGDFKAGHELRAAAAALRSAPLRQARVFLGQLWNAKQETEHAENR